MFGFSCATGRLGPVELITSLVCESDSGSDITANNSNIQALFRSNKYINQVVKMIVVSCEN
jgi:hypothetical protein